jgi:hypothetical protein
LLPIVIPVSLVSLLVGAGLATGRRGLSMLPRSPLPGVLVVRWVRFTRLMARHPRDYAGKRGHLGMFGTDMRGLADAGLAEHPRKTVVGGETGVWDASWRGGLTKKKFLASAPAQYAAFARSMARLAPHAAPHVGAKVESSTRGSTTCTLSGLLGVGHHAGAAGIAGWVKDPAAREKFARTTATFHLVNGVF